MECQIQRNVGYLTPVSVFLLKNLRESGISCYDAGFFISGQNCENNDQLEYFVPIINPIAIWPIILQLGSSMPKQSVIYGNIVSVEDRRKISKKHPHKTDNILWLDKPEMFQKSTGGAIVIVDLDDPKFAAPDFLVSIATAGENVKIIGKSNELNLDDSLRVAKMGVSEILSSNECLERLHQFLTELEEDKISTVPKESKYSASALIGVSPAMKEIRKTLEIIAQVDYPSILLLGNTGTGKGLVAKILHNSGCRSSENMVEVNCSAIPDDLFESELFGHAKGAFTDAKHEKLGLFEYAQNGTLFLDEIGNLSQSAQAKLLKIVEEKKLRRVGDVSETDINVRIVAATNSNLQQAIKDGKFREDLFYRLNLLTIEIPPLRERPEDIPAVAEHYVQFYSSLYGKENLSVSDSALSAMKKYNWPGNVRELCNVIERTVLLSEAGSITADTIISALANKRVTSADREKLIIDLPGHGKPLKDIIKQVVVEVLNMFNWNKSETARYLGISRPRLRRIMSDSDIKADRREL